MRRFFQNPKRPNSDTRQPGHSTPEGLAYTPEEYTLTKARRSPPLKAKPRTPQFDQEPKFSANVNLDAAWRSEKFEYRYCLQDYFPGKKIDSHPLCVSDLENRFRVITEPRPALVYLPICLDEDIYSKPEEFIDYLTAVVSMFKPRPVHIALTIPDELLRHKIYKEKATIDPSFKPKRNSSTLRIETTDDLREEAKTLGDTWLEKFNIGDLEQKVGCRITLFRWGELVTPGMTSDKLRALFIGRMEVDLSTGNLISDVSISELIQYVDNQYKLGTGFAADVHPKLNEVFSKDKAQFSDKTNVTISYRTNKKYLLEEVGHTMQVFTTGVFDATIQAQLYLHRKFKHKTGISLFGEILYHWSCELLNLYLSEKKRFPSSSINLSMIAFPDYITVGRYPSENTKSMVVKSTKSATREQHASKPPTSTLYQIITRAVEGGNLKPLSESEEKIFQQAVNASGRKRSLEESADQEKEVLPNEPSLNL